VIRADEKGGISVRSVIIGRKNIVDANGEMIPLMVGFCVAYDGGICTDWYFDEKFISTGEPSGDFSGSIDLEKARQKFQEFERRFNSQI
jgi:hypothetical protein